MRTFGELVARGGPVMWPILVVSLVGFAVIVERFVVLRRAVINVNEFLAKVRRALMVNRSLRDAIKVCEQSGGPVASVMKAGLLRYGRPKQDIERTIENAASFEAARLERGLGALASCARIAPLLGFLGTVLGMIDAFEALSRSGLSNPAAVADGISAALITTASGLVVALPMQLAHDYFSTRIDKFGRDIESAAFLLIETFGDMDRSGIADDRALEAAPARG